MKKHIFFILTLFIIPSLFAQSDENKIFSYIGVFSTNISDRNYWSNGTSLGLGLDLNINERVSFLSFVEFSYLPINESNVKKRVLDLDINSANIRIDRGTVYMFNISGNIKYKILTSNMITPYLIAGLGFLVAGTDGATEVRSYDWRTEVENPVLRINYQEEAFSSNFGAGFEVDFNSKFGMFLDLRYFIGFTDDLSTSIPFRMGITYKL